MRSSRNIRQAIEAPTIREAVKVIGEEPMIVMIAACIGECMMDFYSPKQRLSHDEAMSFAETLVDDYQYDSVADIRVFLKRAAMGNYGEVNSKGEVVKKGQTYGPLTLMRMGVWWEQYLGEKAEEHAKLQVAKKHPKPPGETSQLLLGPSKESEAKADALIDKVAQEMRRGVAEAKAQKKDDTGRRIDRLLRTIPHMSDDRLRHAYRTAQTEREKIAVLQEANHRGLVQKKIEEHLKNR